MCSSILKHTEPGLAISCSHPRTISVPTCISLHPKSNETSENYGSLIFRIQSKCKMPSSRRTFQNHPDSRRVTSTIISGGAYHVRHMLTVYQKVTSESNKLNIISIRTHSIHRYGLLDVSLCKRMSMYSKRLIRKTIAMDLLCQPT